MIIKPPDTLLTLREGNFVISHLTTDLVEAADRVRVARIEFALPFLGGAMADAAREALDTNGRHANSDDELFFHHALTEEPIRSAAIAEDGTERHVLKTTFSDDELLYVGVAAIAMMETEHAFLANPTKGGDEFDPTDFSLWLDRGIILDADTKQAVTGHLVDQALEYVQLAHGIAVAIRHHLLPPQAG